MYQAGDAIPNVCTDCGIQFDYIYPGVGRPTGHRCPACYARAHTRQKPGDVIQSVCKRCGNAFEQIYNGNGTANQICPECKQPKLGKVVQITCQGCGITFDHARNAPSVPQRCPTCRKRHNHALSAESHRRTRNSPGRGAQVITHCKHCGEPIEQTVFSSRRRCCDRCKRRYHNTQKLQRIKEGKLNGWCLEHWLLTLRVFDNRCVYCGADGKDAELFQDHFIPFTAGGGTTIGNIVPACRRCNASKNDKMPIEFTSKENIERISQILLNLPILVDGLHR